jgi:hypothetical protein
MDDLVRMYHVLFVEDGEEYEAVIPEWMLPEIDNITSIDVVGFLHGDLTVVRIEDPEDPEKEPIPLREVSGE